MAKRSCPFVDFPRERKVCITNKIMDKELANNMQEVYERTRKMLFEGALNQDKNRNVTELSPEVSEVSEDSETESKELLKPQILRGQCQLDSTGKLIPYEKTSWCAKSI